jgi:hypothetical protein
MRSRQNGIGFGQTLTVLAGLAVLASASGRGSGGPFARWSPSDEITSLRTSDSRTFDNHNGTRSVIIAGPVAEAGRPEFAPTMPDTTRQAGNGDIDDAGIWQSSWGFFSCQHIYLASELDFAGTIHNLAFFTDDPCAPETMFRSHQFLADIQETAFTRTAWDYPGAEVWTGTLVRDGTGWLEIELSAGFNHNRSSSLMVSFRHTDSTGVLPDPYRLYHATDYPSGRRSKRGQSGEDTLPSMTYRTTRPNLMITYAPSLVDAQARAVISPPDCVPWGQPCLPQAVVSNNGDASATFSVQLCISDGYSAASTAVDLLPGAEDTIDFVPWTPDSAGTFTVKCSTCLVGDQHPENDRLTDSVFVVRHDVGVSRILAPTGIIGPGDSALPAVVVRNYGTADAQPWVTAEIRNDSAVVYRDSMQVSVAHGDSALARFAHFWHADTHRVFLIQAWTFGSPDVNPANDTARDSVIVCPRAADIGVVAIYAPGAFLDSGAVVIPCARLRNFSAIPATGLAHFAISDSPPYQGDTVFIDLAPGAEQDVRFPSWTAHRCGNYTARCSLGPDDNPGNDTLSIRFEVQTPSPWHRMADVPRGARHKAVRGGAALASDGMNLVYALKGNRTREFYAYQVAESDWVALCSVPGRHARRAATLCRSPGSGRVYAARAGSREFWSFRPNDNTWHQRADIPSGISNRKPSPGLALATMDTGRIYLLNGGTREFYAYDPPHDTWLTLADAPAGASRRGYRAGSCLVAVRDYLYVLKGGQNEFFAYSTLDDTWYARATLPMTGRSGTAKPARTGTAMTRDRDGIYVVKGRSGGELWWYDTFGDSWVEQRSLPSGIGLRPSGDGGALAIAADRLLYLKGNNSFELWSYDLGVVENLFPGAGCLSDTPGGSAIATTRLAVWVTPNPFNRKPSIKYSLLKPGRVSLKIYEVSGRLALNINRDAPAAGLADIELESELPPGVYIIRLSGQDGSATVKLVSR